MSYWLKRMSRWLERMSYWLERMSRWLERMSRWLKRMGRWLERTKRLVSLQYSKDAPLRELIERKESMGAYTGGAKHEDSYNIAKPIYYHRIFIVYAYTIIVKLVFKFQKRA
jgi:hypothetical protein